MADRENPPITCVYAPAGELTDRDREVLRAWRASLRHTSAPSEHDPGGSNEDQAADRL